MILIADSGSTKTTWSFFDRKGNRKDFITEGYNPYYLEANYIISSIRKSLGENIFFHEILHIYFYGAGCEDSKKDIILISLQTLFKNAKIEVDSDMMAASKALLGNGTGLACILGTGTNSCLVSNGKIVHQVESLGFLLGDEGSGAYLGRKLLSLYARKALPERIMNCFYEDYGILPNEILSHFYDAKLQNRFAAGFSPFLKNNISDLLIQSLVREGLVDFFENIISKYPNFKIYELNCVGSIGFVFKDILSSVAEDFGMVLGKIYQSPMDSLCNYHFDNIEIL